MSEISDNSIHMIVTSPPFNVNNNTYKDDRNFQDYLNILREVFRECLRVLVPGGKMCINVADTGRKPFIPLHYYVTKICFEELGMLLFGINIWNKGIAVAANMCSMGTWLDAKNPSSRDCHEFILIFVKHGNEINSSKKIDKYILPCKGFEKSKTLTGSDFARDTFSVWTFSPENDKKIRAVHTAPFPVELPKRCIEFLTRPGMIVLDPFGGVGTTAIACLSLPEPRHYILYEIEKKFVDFAEQRIKDIANECKYTNIATNPMLNFFG